jgi:hypothetical protein
MATCRSCRAEIVWALTDKGARMPVDAKSATDGNLVLYRQGGEQRVRSVRLPEDQLRPRHTSHFATCPNADHHRKDR